MGGPNGVAGFGGQMSDFEVKDRRLFDKDGNINEEAGEAYQPPKSEQAAPSEPSGPSEESELPPLTIGDLPATMTTLIIGLATQALVQLGEPPERDAPPQPPDLPAAKHTIDLLGILQRKTQGNLDSSEDSLLEALLYDLRMKYVAIKKGS